MSIMGGKNYQRLALLFTVTASLLLVFSFASQQVNADHNADEFEAGRIIDDSVFTDKGSMSVQEIQNFLISKNSVCLKDYRSPEPLGSNNYGDNVSAAKVIHKSAQLFNLNPQVLIVTLQKEQGLVTRGDCPSWRYQTAMGFGCPDGQPCDAKWYGFSRQMYQGARHFRGFFDQASGWYVPYVPGDNYILWHPDRSCGGSNVFIENRATASLYSYTPYRPNQAALDAGYGSGNACSSYGNRNFFLYFSDWFGDAAPGSNILLMREDGGSKIYLIDNDRKIHIATYDAFKAWGFNELPVTVVSTETINSYQDSTYRLRRFVKSKNTGSEYFVDDKTGYALDEQRKASWGYDVTNRPSVEDEDIIKYLSKNNLHYLVKSPIGPEIYMMDGGTLRHYRSFATLNAWEPNQKMVNLSEQYFCKSGSGNSCEYRFPVGEPLYKQVVATSIDDPSKSFVVNSGKKLPVTDNIKPLFGQNTVVSEATLSRMKTTSTNASPLLKVADKPEVYLLDSATYNHIPTPAQLSRWRIPNVSTTYLSDYHFSLLSEGKRIWSYLAKNKDSNEVSYMIDGLKRRVDSSLVNGVTAGSAPLEVSGALMKLYKNNDDLNPLMTHSDTPHIYFVDGSGIKHRVRSMGALRLIRGPGMRVDNLPSNMIESMETGSTINKTFMNNGKVHVFNSGQYHPVSDEAFSEFELSSGPKLPNATLSTWFTEGSELTVKVTSSGNYYVVSRGDAYGTNDTNLAKHWGILSSAQGVETDLHPYLLSHLNEGNLTPFVRSDNPDDHRIFFYDNGKLFYVRSMATLKNLGIYEFGNIITLSADKISSLYAGEKATHLITPNDSTLSEVFDNGKRRQFVDEETEKLWRGSNFATFYSDNLKGIYGENSEKVTRVIKSKDSNKIYTLEDGKKRWIATLSAYKENYNQYKTTVVSKHLLKSIPTGNNIK